MKTAALTLTILLAMPAGYASAHGTRHHHGWSNSINMMHGPGRTAARTDPNGTAGGPTTVSGTGSSKYGGNNPGAPGSARQ